MSLSIEMEVKFSEFLKDYNIEDILEDILDSFSKDQRKSVKEDIAAWCAENIDENIMLEAYK